MPPLDSNRDVQVTIHCTSIKSITKGLRKLECDVATIYNYIDSLGNKIVTPTLIDPVDLRAILNNIQNIIPSYSGLPDNPNTDICNIRRSENRGGKL